MKIKSPQFNLMYKACLKASKTLIRDFGEIEKLQVSLKGPGDFVTNCDKKVEKILIEELQKARPDYSIISEEAGTIIEEGFDIEEVSEQEDFIEDENEGPLVALSLSELEDKLNEAIENEDYETASTIRDELKKRKP